MLGRFGRAALGGTLLANAAFLSACVPENTAAGGGPLPAVWFGADASTAELSPSPLNGGASRGARIEQVAFNGPAEAAGIHQGDIILTFDGKPVASGADVIAAEVPIKEPRTVPIVLIRDGRRLTLDTRLDVRPQGGPQPRPAVWLGASFNTVEFPPTPVSDGLSSGSRVEFIVPGSPAATAGLREGDVILRFDGKPAAPVQDLVRAIGAIGGPRVVPIVLIRDGEPLTLEATPGPPPADINAAFMTALVERITLEQKTASEMKAASNWRGAFEHYVTAQRLLLDQNAKFGTGIDTIMRSDIAQVAEILPKLRPPPGPPAEAERHNRRAIAILENAVSDRDNDRAANEFGQAIYEAPWVPGLYLNRGLVYAKAGYPEAAASDLNRYLAFDPTASDAASLRQKIGALEAVSEARKPWYPYLRSWSMESGAIENITLRDRKLIVGLAWPAKADRRTPGTVICSGVVDGRTFHGTCVDYMTSADEIKCFGNKIAVEADGAIDSSNTLVLRYRGKINYNTQSCRINSQDWIVYRKISASK